MIDNTVQARELISELEYAILGVQVAGNLDRVTKAKAALAAALTAPAAVEGWQPIETAPKDGALVLLWCSKPVDRLYTSPTTQYCIGFYGDGGAYHYREGWQSIESREEIWGYGSEYTGPMSETENLPCEPTHWQPLPRAPGAAPVVEPGAQAGDAIRALIAEHGRLLEDSEYTYFELAYTRQTGWMAWITDKPLAYVVESPDRKVLAQGQGETPDEACREAIDAARSANQGEAQ